MSTAAAPAPTAPAAAPAPSAAPSTTPATPSGAQTPAAAQTPAPPTPRTPVTWKTKHKIGDVEHELDLDVSPFLESYKRKVKVDGQEMEVGIDDLSKSYERVRASMKRFDEATKAKREAEAIAKQTQDREQRIQAALRDPREMTRAIPQLLGQQTGQVMAAILRANPDLLHDIAPVIRERAQYEQMPDDQRRRYDMASEAERRAQEREHEIQRREREWKAREQALKAEEERRTEAIAQERQRQLVAEWVPMLEAAGLPAKLGDKPNQRLIRMVAETLRSAKGAGMPMTVAEAIEEVKAEYHAMVGHTVQQQQQQALQAAQQQPGRSEPVVTEPTRRAPKRYDSAEDFERRLQQSWRR